MGYIYKITNTVNDKKYIGRTNQSIEKRWQGHKRTSRSSSKHKNPLHYDIKEYGDKNFKIEVIEECDNDCLKEREIYWITYYDSCKNGYNISIGGENNHKYDEKIIYQLWDEGLTFKEIRNKLNINKRQLTIILEKYQPFLDQRSERYKISLEKGKRTRAVRQYSLSGEFIKEYVSIKEAAEKTNCSYSNIIQSCKRENYSAAGFKWRYVDENDNFQHKKTSKPIAQYDLCGNLIKTFASITDASITTKSSLKRLSEAVNKNKVFKGYLWLFL